ncbi:hypothetical protein PP626_14570 [Mycobacteroides abscessus]|nr:hypothetical protein [Mycobacteroides abscessus]
MKSLQMYLAWTDEVFREPEFDSIDKVVLLYLAWKAQVYAPGQEVFSVEAMDNSGSGMFHTAHVLFLRHSHVKAALAKGCKLGYLKLYELNEPTPGYSFRFRAGGLYDETLGPYKADAE